jgi:hypothetical protein
MVIAEHRHDCVKAAVSKGQGFGARLDRWSGARRTLGDHHR